MKALSHSSIFEPPTSCIRDGSMRQRPETPVNRSCDIAHANFTPDAGWLKSHNISAVLTCRSDPGGRIRFDIDTLWDAPQPQRPQPGFSMAVTWSLLSFFLIVLTGVGTVILIDRNKSLSLPDVLGTGVAIGAGLLASFLFSASLAGAPPSRILFAGWAFVWGGAGMVRNGMKRQSTPRLLLQAPGTRISVAWWAVITTMVAGSSIVVAAIHAFGTALIEWDAFSIWCLKAKVLAATALQDDPSYFYNPAMSYSHLDYPLLVPFLVSGTYGMTGYVQEHLGRMIFPILFIATAVFHVPCTAMEQQPPPGRMVNGPHDGASAIDPVGWSRHGRFGSGTVLRWQHPLYRQMARRGKEGGLDDGHPFYRLLRIYEKRGNGPGRH